MSDPGMLTGAEMIDLWVSGLVIAADNQQHDGGSISIK